MLYFCIIKTTITAKKLGKTDTKMDNKFQYAKTTTPTTGRGNAFPTAEKFSLTDKVAYAEGSVVSKIIIRNERGNITLFAFDKGEFLSEHTAPFDAIVQVLDGKGEVIIDGQSFELNVGESIIMPANIRHAVVATEQFKMLLTMIK
jgi:quercetin dioxygenase-like cupin family protein